MKSKYYSVFPATVRITSHHSSPLLVIASLAGMLTVAQAADSTWDGDTDGNWNNVLNWTTGALPNSSNAFFNTSTLNNTINLATAVPIFNLNFSAAVGPLGNYTFGGAQFSASGSGSSVSVAANVTNAATITFNNKTQSTTTNRAGPGGYSVSTASGSNANLIFNGNLFGSVATAGIITTVDFKLSNLPAAGGTTTVNGVIANAGLAELGLTGITKTGGGQGVLTLNGANTYSGQTVWNTDTGGFVLGNKTAFGTGALRIAGTNTTNLISASTPLTGANAIANTVNFLGSSLTNTTNLVLTVTSGTNTGTIVSGTAPKVGDMVTAGVTTFLTASTRITAVSGTTVGSTVTFDLNALASGNTASLTTGPTATNNAVVAVTAGSPIGTLVSGVAPKDGDLVTVNGAAHLPLYTRVLTVVGSTITFDTNAATTGNTAALTTVAYTNSSTGTLTVGGTNPVEFSGPQNLSTVYSNGTAATRTFQITNTAGTTFSGTLQQSTGVAGFTKTGAGKLILSGTNTYTGSNAINGGVVQLASAQPLGGSGTVASIGTISFGGGTLQFTAANTTDYSSRFSSGASQGFNLDTNGETITLTNLLASSGGTLNKLGAGSLITTGANSYNGATTITAGTLQVGNGGSTGSLATSGIANSGLLAFNRTGNQTISGPISGTGSVFQTALLGTAVGTTSLTSTTSSYSGTTTIQNGTIDVGANSILSATNGPLGNATSAIILGNANTLASNPASGSPPNALLTITANGVTPQSFTISRDIDSSATANVGGRNNIRYINNTAGGTGTLTVSGNWALASGSSRSNGLTAQQPGQTLDYTGTLSGGNSATRLRVNDFGSGTGKVRLSNSANSYISQTTVTNGTLLIGGHAAAATGVLGANATVNLAEGGNGSNDNAALTDGAFVVGKTISLQDGVTLTSTWTVGGNQPVDSSFTSNVSTVSAVNSRTLNLTQVAGGTVSFTGIIGANANVTGATSLAKIGDGTAILTNANTYDGTTTVTAGTLLANNVTGSATGAGAVTVSSGGTLGGTGIINGSTTIVGTIAPGVSAGTLAIANNVVIDGTYACQLDGAANGDKLVITGDLDIDGATLAVSPLVGGASGDYVIATYTGTRTGTFIVSPALPVGYSVSYATTGEVKLVSGASVSDFDTWIGLYPSITGADKLPAADPDQDGLSNQQEYAFGLIPNRGASVSPITSQVDVTTGLFSYSRRLPALTTLVYTYEYSTTLTGAWTPFNPESTSSNSGSPVEIVTVNLPDSLLGNSKLFVRVVAQ